MSNLVTRSRSIIAVGSDAIVITLRRRTLSAERFVSFHFILLIVAVRTLTFCHNTASAVHRLYSLFSRIAPQSVSTSSPRARVLSLSEIAGGRLFLQQETRTIRMSIQNLNVFGEYKFRVFVNAIILGGARAMRTEQIRFRRSNSSSYFRFLHGMYVAYLRRTALAPECSLACFRASPQWLSFRSSHVCVFSRQHRTCHVAVEKNKSDVDLKTTERLIISSHGCA